MGVRRVLSRKGRKLFAGKTCHFPHLGPRLWLLWLRIFVRRLKHDECSTHFSENYSEEQTNWSSVSTNRSITENSRHHSVFTSTCNFANAVTLSALTCGPEKHVSLPWTFTSRALNRLILTFFRRLEVAPSLPNPRLYAHESSDAEFIGKVAVYFFAHL